LKETELAKKFIEFFNDKFEIYKEVPAEGFIDFVAVNGNIKIGVEVKLSLNFNVIEQALKNKKYCTYSYIAVPKPKNKHLGYKICEDYGIGILIYQNVGGYEYIYEHIKPKVNRNSKYFKLDLQQYMKDSPAGTATDRITPFKLTMENMCRYIQRHPGCTLKKCLEDVDFHWSNITCAKGCVYQWIKKGVIKEFKIENGRLYLNKINN